MPTVDSLDIQISAQAQRANTALDGLISRLDRLSSALTGIQGSGLVGLADGVSRLATSMQAMNGVKATDFNRLAKNIQKLSTLDSGTINSTANAISTLSQSFSGLGAVSQNAMQVGELASNLSKLGYKSIGTATQQMPALANALKNLMATLSTAPKVSRNLIDMTNALARLATAGRSVGSAASGLSSYLNRFSASAITARASTMSLAAAIGKLYANFWLLLRVGRLLGKAITSTADYIESFNYFNVAFNKIGDEWGHQWEERGYDNAEAYAESFANRMSETLGKMSGLKLEVGEDRKTGLLTSSGMKNLGLNIQELTQSASNIAAITNSVGQTGEVSLAAAQSLSALAGDMSSLFNVDYSDVMGNLQSGLIGQSRALYKYGIDITNATLQTYAYEMGLSKAVSEMTQAEKMQLRLIAILDQSKVAWGDLANTINTPSNMIRQFKNNIAELGMTIGQLFIPVLSKVLPFVNGLTIALTRLMTTIAGFFGISLDLQGMSAGFEGLDEEIGGVSAGLDDVAGSAKKAKAGLRGFDELKTISLPSSGGGGGAGGGGGGLDLTDEIMAASGEYMKAWEDAYAQMENRAEGFANRIEKSLEPVKKLFQDISIGDWFAVGGDVSTIVSNIYNSIASKIASTDWEQLGKNIGAFLLGIEWTRIFSSMGSAIWEAINAAIKLYANTFETAPVETAIITAFALLKWTAVGTIVSQGIAKAIAAKLGVTLAKGAGIKAVLAGAVASIGNTFMAGVSGLLGNSAAISALSFINPFIVAISGIGSVIGGLGGAILNFFDMWKGGFDWLNEALMAVGIALGAVGAVILGAPALVAAAVAGIVATVGTLAIVVKDNWDKICGWFDSAGTWFNKNVVVPIANFFKNLWKDVSGFFSNLWEDVSRIWGVVATWFDDNVVSPIVDFYVGFYTRVGQIFEGLWILVQAVWKVASDWFNEKVISPIVTFFEKMFEKVSGFFSSLWEGVSEIWGIASEWFSSNVTTPILEFFGKMWSGVKEYFSSLWEGVKEIWSKVSEWFGDNVIEPVKNAFKIACETIRGFFSGLWDGIVSSLVSAMNKVIGGIESAINSIVKGVNRLIGGFNRIVSWGADVIGKDWGSVSSLSTVSLPRISGYENGGFPASASLFWAGENGIPEIVGTMGGQPAVASGMEITGIRDEIRATANEEMALLRQQNQLLQAILQKEFGITIDEIGRSARAYAEDYFRRTGDEAYSF